MFAATLNLQGAILVLHLNQIPLMSAVMFIKYSVLEVASVLPTSSTLIGIWNVGPNPTGSKYRTIVSPGLKTLAGMCSLYFQKAHGPFCYETHQVAR